MKNLRYALVLICVFFVMLICGCASSTETAKTLDFSDISVRTEARDGFFGGRYASFEVSGLVTNNTGKPINADNLPSLNWDKGRAKPKLSQDKLLDKETCNVTWKDELTVNNNIIPELSFSGGVEHSGLDNCLVDLNKQLQAIAAEYVAADAAKEEERIANEHAKAEAKQKREDDKAALAACEGKTAYEAYEIASDTGFNPRFFDVARAEVTGEIYDGSDAGKSTVTGVRITEAGWFSSDEVSFTLDFEGPDTRAKAEAKQKREDDKAALAACEGKTAYEAYEVASETDFEPSFFDVAGVDVTSDTSSESDAGKATVTGVDITEAGWFSNDRVSFSLDYEDPVTRAEREKKETEEAAQKQAEENLAALESVFPRDAAYRAAVVSLTNQIADDVFADDGNTLEPSKFHSYSDRSGFYLEPVSEGAWSYKDEATWRVEGLEFTIANLGTHVNASCDVHFDGEKYIISNQSGLIGNPGHEEFATHLDEFEKERWAAPALVVTPDLLS